MNALNESFAPHIRVKGVHKAFESGGRWKRLY